MYGRVDEALDKVASRDSSLNLPSVSGTDNGKALIVSGGAWTAAAIPSQLPAVTSSDAGKVLMVNSSGQWVAGTPS